MEAESYTVDPSDSVDICHLFVLGRADQAGSWDAAFRNLTAESGNWDGNAGTRAAGLSTAAPDVRLLEVMVCNRAAELRNRVVSIPNRAADDGRDPAEDYCQRLVRNLLVWDRSL